jgi:hypothetical protein
MTDAPAAPATATEARAVLDARMADKAWGDRVYSGDAAANQELRDLTAKVAAGGDDAVAVAMSGKLPDMATGDQRIMASTADWLRDIGFPPKAIQETLAGREPTAADVERARTWKARAMKNQDYVKRYLSGDGDAIREMTACDVVLSSQSMRM